MCAQWQILQAGRGANQVREMKGTSPCVFSEAAKMTKDCSPFFSNWTKKRLMRSLLTFIENRVTAPFVIKQG